MRTLVTNRNRFADYPVTTPYSLKNSSGSTTVSGTVVSKLDSSNMDDVNNPGFYTKQRTGEIIMNDMSRTLVHSENTIPTYLNKCKYRSSSSWIVDQSGTLPASVILGFPSSLNYIDYNVHNIDQLVNKAIAKAHAKVSAADWQALASLGEARETIRLITDSLRKALAIFKALKGSKSLGPLKRELGKTTQNSASVANAYLQFRYGVRPLVYEIHSAMKSLRNIGQKPRVRFVGVEEQTSLLYDSGVLINWSSVNRNYYRSTYVVHTATAGVLVEVDVSGITVADSLGMDEVLQSAWELVPWSFVIDWFLNIGDLVSMWAPKAHTRVVGTWVTVEEYTRQRNELTGYASKLTSADYSPHSLNVSGDCYLLHERTQRRRWANPSKPVIPSLDMNLDVTKILDLVALFRQFV